MYDQVYYGNGPLKNVLVGVSVENQASTDERIPELLQTPAAVRFLSMEPLLEAVTLSSPEMHDPPQEKPTHPLANPKEWDDWKYWAARDRGVSWIAIGGESGPNARPCYVEWIRSILKQCEVAGVPCFVKQLGAVPVIRKVSAAAMGPEVICEDREICSEWPDGTFFGNPTGISELNGRVVKLKDRAGAVTSEWPADLRVRQFPEVKS